MVKVETITERNLRLVRQEKYELEERLKHVESENKRMRTALKTYGWVNIGAKTQD